MKHMKHLKQLLAPLTFVTLIILTNCGPDDKKKPSPAADQAKLLALTWNLDSNGAKLESATQADWNEFELKLTGDGDGGSYTTSESQTTDVWPARGTWKFDGDDIGVIVRDDGVKMDISSVTSSRLVLGFKIEGTSGSTRSSGVDGNWTFTFTN